MNTFIYLQEYINFSFFFLSFSISKKNFYSEMDKQLRGAAELPYSA